MPGPSAMQLAVIEQQNRDRKAAELADTARIAAEATQRERDLAQFAAEASAAAVAVAAERKRRRDERYAKRAAQAKRLGDTADASRTSCNRQGSMA
jgi:hypothetical protein